MRTIHTFILRILVDSNTPLLLHGSLQAVDEKEEAQHFSGEAALLALLRKIPAAQVKNESEQDEAGT